MPLNDLSNLKTMLASVAGRLGRFRSVDEKNETAVREQIVLPILRGLGWDTENPDDVHPEDRTSSGSPDYTLKVDSRPVVTVEVKKLGVDVAQPGALEQAHRHASASGIELCMATNGTVWVLARSFEPGRDLRGRIIWQVLLSENTLDEVLQKLVLIARPNISDLNSFVELQDVLEERWEELLGDPEELVTVISKLPRERLSNFLARLPYPRFVEDYVDQRVRELLALDTQSEVMGQPDTTMQDSGSISSVRRGSVAEMLLEAAERGIRERRLSTDTQIETGHKRHLINKTPVHKSGRQFLSPRQLSNGLYMETHCSVDTARRYASLLNNYRPRR
jgi:hypothetical protein